MNRIDELIAELAPNGVELKPLAEIGTVIRGKRFVKDDMQDTGVPCIHYGEIYTKYGVSAKKSISCVSTTRAQNLRFANPGDVIIASAGETIEDIGKSVAWLGSEPIAIHDACYAFSSKLTDPTFASYFFASRSFRDQIRRHISSSKISSISTQSVSKALIPVPPLEVQREIVRILDQFTQLEAELEAELEARRRQYDHYRNLLLTPSGETRWSTLGGVSKHVSSGGTPRAGSAEYYEGGTIPWLRTNEVKFGEVWDTEVLITEAAVKKTSAKWIPENCVIIAISGATAGRSAINKIPLTTNQHCCNLEIDGAQANYRYVFHWVSAKYEELKSFGRGARADLNAALIKGFAIPVPPLDEQERIVRMLDSFDNLINGLSIGLPAELRARGKQYEYYRDKLLTFEELPA